MTAALIGLGIASAAYSIYRGAKSDSQVNRANDINENAANLSYQAQKETNEMNYRIFQEQLGYNSPENLKNMYDALGLNGSAIVANQGFTPTAAPQMVAPHQDQVSFTPYNSPENPADKMMQSLITALSSSKMRAEIEKTVQERINIEALTESCKVSTEGLVKDNLLKGFDLKLKENEVSQINEKNAELRLTVESLRQDVANKPDLQKRVLRQFDDKHALDVVDEILKKLDVKEKGINIEYLRQTLNDRVATMYYNMCNAIKQGETYDLSHDAAKIANYVAYETRQSRIDAENAHNRNLKASENYEASKIERITPGTGEDNISNVTEFANRLVWTFGIVGDAIVSPLKGIIKVK